MRSSGQNKPRVQILASASGYFCRLSLRSLGPRELTLSTDRGTTSDPKENNRLYSISSSASASSVGGISRPSALAVLRLSTLGGAVDRLISGFDKSQAPAERPRRLLRRLLLSGSSRLAGFTSSAARAMFQLA